MIGYGKKLKLMIEEKDRAEFEKWQKDPKRYVTTLIEMIDACQRDPMQILERLGGKPPTPESVFVCWYLPMQSELRKLGTEILFRRQPHPYRPFKTSLP